VTDLLTTAQAADLAGITPAAFRKAASTDPALREAKTMIDARTPAYPRSAVEAWRTATPRRVRRIVSATLVAVLALTVSAYTSPGADLADDHMGAAAAALMIAASCNADVGAVVAEIVNTSDEARAEMDAFYAAGEAWQVAQARAKYAAGIPLTSAC
jgi:hypothetical protein